MHRHIIFIDGYDPKGGRRIYADQKKQLALYCDRFGQNISISEQDTSQHLRLRWHLHEKRENVRAQFDVLRWDDIVRKRWARDDLSMVREAIASLWEFSLTGQLRHMWQLSRPLVYAAMLPYALALVAIVVPILLGLATSSLHSWLMPSDEWVATSAIGMMLVSAWLAYRLLRSMSVTWVLRVVAFARHYAHETSTETSSQSYRKRIRDWAQTLKPELSNSDADEILIVGYSAGSILATGLLPELARLLPSAQKSKLSLLTLGNCIPVSACLPNGESIRGDLQAIAQQGFAWLDITSPADWASIYGLDPACVYAKQPPCSERLQLSPRFHTLFTPSSYDVMRKDKYRVHQQYLQCTELLSSEPSAYDYFALLCGTMSIKQRYNLFSTVSV